MESGVKQVIVVNESMRLPRGKLATQVAHASVAAFLEASDAVQRTWVAHGMPKVVLHGDDVELLLALHAAAQRNNLPVALIADAGRTLIPAGTVTCVGIGPASEQAIGQLTGDLKLVR